MTLSIPCTQFRAWERPKYGEMVDVHVDQLSVDICLTCTLDDCVGPKSVGVKWRGLHCAYDRAVAERLWGEEYVERVGAIPPER